MFGAYWARAFPAVAPIPYLLRSALPERWLRFHALPDARRYPGSPAELDQVVARAQTLGDALFSGEVWLAKVHHGAPSDPLVDRFGLTEAGTTVDPTTDSAARVFATVTRWSPGAFDDLFRARAEDTTYGWLFAQGRSALAPYDGGFDLVLPSPADVAALAGRFPGWLPADRERYQKPS
jgi:hypothetical protein